jgi:uncharacterized protein
MERLYLPVIEAHLRNYRQMVILVGPDSAGKTTLCREISSSREYVLSLNWSITADRELILSGPENILSKINMKSTESKLPIVVFDNLSHYPEWKNLLKGYYDALYDQCRLIIIANEKVGIYRSGQDSMMGRYFSYQMHPLSVSELCKRNDFSSDYSQPKKIAEDDWNTLLKCGGFPEPFLKSTESYHSQWSKNRHEYLIESVARQQARIKDSRSFDLLINLLERNVGQATNFSSVARALQMTVPTVQHWHEVLSNHYYCFSLSPWTNNIKRSLQKSPKYYLYDWSQISDERKRIENLVACHLKKAIDFWNDIGLGSYQLFYVRDKDKHEVDFLVIKNDEPWIMLDVKSSTLKKLSRSLLHFQEQLNVPHVFQLSLELPYTEKDCFSVDRPVIVPMKTFLSQLI